MGREIWTGARRMLAILAAVGLTYAAAEASLETGSASAPEVVSEDDLRTVTDFRLSSPLRGGKRALPELAFHTSVRSLENTPVPRMSRIVLTLDPRIALELDGLPECRFAALRAAPWHRVRQICHGAVVGHAYVTVRVDFPGQAEVATIKEFAALNGRFTGRPAILLKRVPRSGAILADDSVITFRLRKRQPGGPTRLIAAIPEDAHAPVENSYPPEGAPLFPSWISHFDLTLARGFGSKGERQSYVDVDCGAPTRAYSFGFRLAFLDGSHRDGAMRRSCESSA